MNIRSDDEAGRGHSDAAVATSVATSSAAPAGQQRSHRQNLNERGGDEDVRRGTDGLQCPGRGELAHEPEGGGRECVSALRHGDDEGDDAQDVLPR